MGTRFFWSGAGPKKRYRLHIRVSNSDERNLPRPAVFLGGYGRFVAVTAEAFAASRQHKRAITTAAIHDIMHHNHNKNIPYGL